MHMRVCISSAQFARCVAVGSASLTTRPAERTPPTPKSLSTLLSTAQNQFSTPGCRVGNKSCQDERSCARISVDRGDKPQYQGGSSSSPTDLVLLPIGLNARSGFREGSVFYETEPRTGHGKARAHVRFSLCTLLSIFRTQALMCLSTNQGLCISYWVDMAIHLVMACACEYGWICDPKAHVGEVIEINIKVTIHVVNLLPGDD